MTHLLKNLLLASCLVALGACSDDSGGKAGDGDDNSDSDDDDDGSSMDGGGKLDGGKADGGRASDAGAKDAGGDASVIAAGDAGSDMDATVQPGEDAGKADAGKLDASAPDASKDAAAPVDAKVVDSAVVDSAVADAATDAGGDAGGDAGDASAVDPCTATPTPLGCYEAANNNNAACPDQAPATDGTCTGLNILTPCLYDGPNDSYGCVCVFGSFQCTAGQP